MYPDISRFDGIKFQLLVSKTQEWFVTHICIVNFDAGQDFLKLLVTDFKITEVTPKP